MKRMVALFLTLGLLLSMAACGGAPASSAPQEPVSATESAEPTTTQPDEPDVLESLPVSGEAETAEATPAEDSSTIKYPLDEAVTLTALGAIYQPRTADKITSWSESLPYVEAAKATGVTIDMTCVASSAQQEQTQLTIASGDLPDLMTSLDMYYQVEDLVDQDIIIDLMPYLEEYAPDYIRTVREMGYEKDIVTDNGVSPATYHISEGVPMFGMVIRKDLLDEANLDVPVTYEDYDNVLAAFKSMGVVEPFALDGTSTGMADVYNAGLGVQLYSHPIMGTGKDGFYQVDGEVKFGYLEDGFVTYVTQMADWYAKGYISPDYITENENNNSEDFNGKVTAGDVGVLTATRTNIDTYNQDGQLTNPDFEIIPVASPRVEANQEIHIGSWRPSSLSSGFFVTSACDSIAALLAWHNYWFTEEGHMLSNYGVEGQTYEMVDGEPVYTEMITNNPDGLTLTQTTYIFISQMGVMDNSREDQLYSEVTVEAKRLWSENVDNAWKIPGSCSMTAEESEQYSSTFSDIQTHISEMLPKFIMGDEPIENLGEFQDTIRSMGIETCIAAWQSALDRYNER